jgi:RNA processing factor Prp31
MIKYLSERVVGLIQYREEMQEYLKDRMESVTPNVAILAGENV